MRKVNFKTLNGNVFTIECDPDTSIQTLKPKLAMVSSIAVERQRLLYKAQVLEDSKKLSDYVKEDDQTVHLVERPAGAAGPGAQPNPAAGMRMPGGPAGGPPGGFPFPIPGGGFGAPPGGAGGPPPALANMLNNLMGGAPGGPGGAPGQPPNLQNIMRNLGDIVGQFERPAGASQGAPNAAAPPRAQPAPAPAQQAAPAQAAAAAGAPQVMQLPHQVLFRLGQICNHLNGPGASFPGPTMPQLQVERNIVVLLGSYMTNLVLQLQRLMPLMSRAGDLMQRESLMTSQAERDLTQDLAQNLGKAMEDISRATGSVAHFYRTINFGASGSQAQVQVAGYEQSFKGIIEEVKSVQPRGGAPVQPAAPAEEEKQAPAPAAARTRSLNDMPDPLEGLTTVVQSNDIVAIMMQNYAAANPLPRRMHDYVIAKKNDYGNNTRHAEHIGRRIQSHFSNAGSEDKIKDVNSQNPCDIAKELFVDLTSDIFDKIISEDAYAELEPFMEFMKPTCLKGLASCMEQLGKCFKNDTTDALEWIRSNIYQYYKAQGCDALPPHMRENPTFVEGLYKGKTNTAFNMIKQMYSRALELYPAGEPQDDEEMKNEEEEQKADVAEPSGNPLDRFRQIMAKDKAFIEQAKYDQGAPSRAYSSTCSFTQDKVLPMSEAVAKQNDYMKDRSKKLSEMSAAPIVRDKIRRNLIINGGFPQSKVEEKLGAIGEIPKEIAEAYMKMQKAAVRFRLAQDDDFKRMQKDKFADAPQNPQIYNNLKDF